MRALRGAVLAPLAVLLLAAPAFGWALPARGTWVGRATNGEWVTFTVDAEYLRMLRLSTEPPSSGTPPESRFQVLSAKLEAGRFRSFAPPQEYRGLWCDADHMSGIETTIEHGEFHYLRFHAHLEHSTGPNADPCPKLPLTDSAPPATVPPSAGSWSGRTTTQTGSDIAFRVRDGKVLSLTLTARDQTITLMSSAGLIGGTFVYDNRRGRVIEGRFCDAHHMDGVIVHRVPGNAPARLRFYAHLSGHGKPGERPCPPVPVDLG